MITESLWEAPCKQKNKTMRFNQQDSFEKWTCPYIYFTDGQLPSVTKVLNQTYHEINGKTPIAFQGVWIKPQLPLGGAENRANNF